MPDLRPLLTAALLALAPAGAARAELNIEVSFSEKQSRTQGLSRKRSTCNTTYAIKTLGPLLFLETKRSDCRTFRVGDLQGADGSAAAIVFEGPNARTSKRCSYSAANRTERCSDGSRVRVPDGPKVDYQSQITTRSQYSRKASGLTLSRVMQRELKTAEGSEQRTDAELQLRLVMNGKNCELVSFSSKAQSRVVRGGSGKLSESRELARAGACRVISR